MRLLADENIPGDVVATLRMARHDVIWIRTDQPGSAERDVLARAQEERRILLTFDKDFGELAWRERLPAVCGVVLFRLADSTIIARYRSGWSVRISSAMTLQGTSPAMIEDSSGEALEVVEVAPARQ